MSSALVVPARTGPALLELWPLGSTAGGQVVEGGAYKYRLKVLDQVHSLEPSELFEPDPDDARTGRFFPRNHVGRIDVVATTVDGGESTFPTDVGTSKLDFATQYRAMMSQIADHAAEAILQGFAPASSQVAVSADSPGEVAYRALAFLVARLRDEQFQSEVDQIARRPNRRWIEELETHPINRGLPASAAAARQMTAAARRVRGPEHLAHLPSGMVPERIDWRRNRVTFDTPPNRFVRHAFERWRGLALDMLASLDGKQQPGSGPRRRGIQEARWLVDRCDELLSTPPLAEAGPLRRFPHGDPVLLRQAGYRDVLKTYAMADASIALDAVMPDDAFAATQRNVATLYEYWCFLALVGCLDRIFGTDSIEALFRASESGLSLVLRQGAAHRLQWDGEVRGRRLHVDLWFNRQFSKADQVGTDASSWAGSMRPDVSLRLRPQSGRPEGAVDPAMDVWVHFDAKYRISAADVEITDDPAETARRGDVLKMHSYRDAIRRSAGAYVLYPGSGAPSHRREFHEVLPGIGAFPLRPCTDGSAQGAEALQTFLKDVLDHAANQASAAERTQYWLNEHNRRPGRRIRPTDLLKLPPADEQVLLGYVRADQWEWVRRQRRYNLRADQRRGAVRLHDEFLAARLVVLWTFERGVPIMRGLFERVGPWQVASSEDLVSTGYPDRDGGALYLVCEINAAGAKLDQAIDIARLAALSTDAEPRGTTWDKICS
jgi:predicted component of viral defense system (DUF524 family)